MSRVPLRPDPIERLRARLRAPRAPPRLARPGGGGSGTAGSSALPRTAGPRGLTAVPLAGKRRSKISTLFKRAAIKRSVVSTLREVILPLCPVLVRPVLENCV